MDTNSTDQGLSAAKNMPCDPSPVASQESELSQVSGERWLQNYAEHSSAQSSDNPIRDDLKAALLKRVSQNRKEGGLEELPSTDAKKRNIEALSVEEEEKRRIRRDKNRRAAFKCRQKKKMESQARVEEYRALSHERTGLENTIKDLEIERERLQRQLVEHRCVLKDDGTTKSSEAKSP